MYFQWLLHVGSACLSYIFYYICRLAAAWLMPSVGAVTRTAIASAVFVCAVVGYRFAFKEPSQSAVSIKRITLPDAAVLCFAGAAFNVLFMVLLSLIPFPDAWLFEYGKASSAISASGAALTFVFSVIIAPITEELMFRGLMYGNLRSVMPKWAALGISALLFGVGHGAIVWVIYAVFFGAVLAFIYEKFGSLAAPILFHSGFNLIGALTSSGWLGDRFIVAAIVPSLAAAVFAVAYTVRKKV